MITTFLWTKDKTVKGNLSRAEMLSALKDPEALLWVDLENPTDFESECLVEIFNFHPLAVEDCLSDHSEPKVDDYDEYLFLVQHAVRIIHNEDKEIDELTTKELALFFGENFVVTFHKIPINSVAQVRDAVRRKPDGYLGHGTDRLVHALLDRLVDNYQPVLNMYDKKIDELEEEIFNHPSEDFLADVIQVKQDVFHLRRIIMPQRDTVNYLTRNTEEFIQEQNLMYFRDIYDHLYRIYRIAEGYHENLTSIMQAYFSYSSHKLNEVVKHMTVMATLTMPAVIVASIYGMNFRHMPELDWKWGYPLSFLLMGIMSLSMIGWMKWKKWL